MKAREILVRLTRRFGLVVLLTLLGGVAGAVYGAVKTPEYTAKAYVVAIGDAGDPNTPLNFAQAYGRVATTGPVLAAARALLGKDTSGLDRVTASTSPDAPVIEIDATGPSAGHTTSVANAVGKALAAYGTVRKTDTHVGLAVLASATKPDKPTSPQPPLELLVGAAGGLLIGGLAVLAGAGSPGTKRKVVADEEPEPYTAEEPLPVPGFDGPDEIEQHLSVWRSQYGQQAITAYRSSATTEEEPAAEEADETKPAGDAAFATRIVGRASVAGMEEDDE